MLENGLRFIAAGHHACYAVAHGHVDGEQQTGPVHPRRIGRATEAETSRLHTCANRQNVEVKDPFYPRRVICSIGVRHAGLCSGSFVLSFRFTCLS